ncbi:alpha/beta fold hydrolase [Paenibacillus glycanilyticus]|uniref:alpha/beta fold hydrolase n=1 Tax=Paenibacillus glycanilyticus TaxID=126569 RepID=UPI0037CCACEF
MPFSCYRSTGNLQGHNWAHRSSSHMFRDLIPLLADRYYVIAPDYPGYGNSSMPLVNDFSYTFEHLSLIIEQLINQLCIPCYILYAPLGSGLPFGIQNVFWVSLSRMLLRMR